jgi:hypothetical protein
MITNYYTENFRTMRTLIPLCPADVRSGKLRDLDASESHQASADSLIVGRCFGRQAQQSAETGLSLRDAPKAAFGIPSQCK